MSGYVVWMHVEFEHEPGHVLAPEDRALNAVELGFSELEIPVVVTIDDVNTGGAT